MRKIFHESLHDWAKPVNPTEPVHVCTFRVGLDEIKTITADLFKRLAQFNGYYQLVVEFTEANEDPRFVLGHIGVVITIRAENESLAKKMLALI